MIILIIRTYYTIPIPVLPKHSTSLAVETVVDYILNIFENKLIGGSNLIDLTKVFGTSVIKKLFR